MELFATLSESPTIALSVAFVATILLCSISLLYLLQRDPRKSTSQLPPGTFGLPFFGETFDFLRTHRVNKASEFVEARVAKYGEIFKTSLFFQPTVVINGPVANHFLFANENKLVKESWPSSFIKTLGENTLVAKSGTEHKRLRQLVMTCLYPEALQKFVAKVDALTEQHFTDYWVGSDQITLYNLVKMHTFDVASILLVNVEDKATRQRLEGLFETFIAGMLRLPINFPGTRYRKAHLARACLIRELDQLVSHRKKEMDRDRSAGAQYKDLVSILLTAKDPNGNSLTQEEIQDLILTLLFAGHDTNSSTISLVCKFLSENPACCAEVLKEQTGIAQSKKPGQKLTWEDIQKMKYTWRVVQETLRLQPAVQGSFKVALKDLEYGGFKIPCGWKIYHSIAFCHLDERYFPNPKKFDPSRFEGTGPQPYTYLPFGGGPHICPGIDFAKMVMLVFFHHLVLRFKWTLVDPMEQVCIDPMPVPLKGFPIKLEKRESPLNIVPTPECALCNSR